MSTLADLSQSGAQTLNDPNKEIFHIEDWRRFINSAQDYLWPRLFLIEEEVIVTEASKVEYDFPTDAMEITKLKVQASGSSSLYEPIDPETWQADYAVNKIILESALTVDLNLKIQYKKRFSKMTKDSAICEAPGHTEEVIILGAVKRALNVLKLDRAKLNEFRTTIDDQISVVGIQNMINDLDTNIELRLRELDMRSKVGRIRIIRSQIKPGDKYRNPQWFLKHG